MPTVPQTLTRRTGETPRTYYFSFALFPEISSGADSLSSVVGVTAAPSGLTPGTPVITGDRVACQISGGSNGVTYLVKCLAQTVGGSRLECDGYLQVVDP
jgi:hypothetical protein